MRLNAALGIMLTTARQHGPYLQRAMRLAKLLQKHPSETVRRKASITEAEVWNQRGVVHWEDQRYAEAIACYQRYREVALQINATELLLLAANNIGLLLNNIDLPEKAMAEYKAGFELAKRHDDRTMVSIMLGRIGDTYMRLGDTARADSHLVLSINTAPEPFWSMPARMKLAELRLAQARPKDAVTLVNSVKAMCEQDAVDGPSLLGYAYLVHARCDTAMGRLDRAFQQLDTCIQRTQATSTAQWCSRCLMMRAALFEQAGDYRKEEADLQRALGLSHGRTLLVERARAAHQLKALYARQGRTADELRITELWKTLGDSIHAMDVQKALMVVDFKMATSADSVAYLINQNATDLAHATELGAEQNRRTWLLAALLLAMGTAVGVWARLRTVRRANEVVQAAQAQVIEVEKLREAEAVRTRIARDVHDQLGSDLTKLVLLSSEVQALATGDTAAMSAMANDIERVAGEANRSLGDIVWAIDPHHDSLAGLTERVRLHCERMLKWSKVQHSIDCIHTGPDRSLDPATKSDIYLILRESLNNAIKYAQAKHISVVLHTDPRSVHLVVKDDGIGFSASGTKAGHGLANMQARADRMGAQLQMDGNKGSTLQLDLALSP